jgi:hypothetical protein
MDRTRHTGRAALVLVLALAVLPALTASAVSAYAQGLAGGYEPRVPVSKFARPAGWLDPSRLRIATSVSVGTGYAGKASGLQVTSFAYQFQRPVWLEVSLGNAFGAGNAGSNGMFLESLRFGFRPSANTTFQVQFRDMRSPLQYGYGHGYGHDSLYDPYGYHRW